MAKVQIPLGHGTINWLGVNEAHEAFSQRRWEILITDEGIQGDAYCGMWRQASGHDGGYIATDGIKKGDRVLNLRQITIVEESEISEANALAGPVLLPGMLRENIVVHYVPAVGGARFSQLPPMARMVIGHGEENPKILILTEENGPCPGICNPIAMHFGGDHALAASLKERLTGRRGQMAMVRNAVTRTVQIGDTFTIFPPMP